MKKIIFTATLVMVCMISGMAYADWEQLTGLPRAVGQPGAAVVNGHLVVFGGQYLDSWDSNTEFNSIYMAEIGSDNSVGPWATAGTLPIAGIFLSDSAFLINDQTVIVAISSNGADVQVFKGRISNDQIGEWEIRGRAWWNFGGKSG